MSVADAEIYMETCEKVLDNLVQMGIPVEIKGVLKVTYDYRQIKDNMRLHGNKQITRSTMKGKNLSMFVGNWISRKVKPK